MGFVGWLNMSEKEDDEVSRLKNKGRCVWGGKMERERHRAADKQTSRPDDRDSSFYESHLSSKKTVFPFTICSSTENMGGT